MANTYPLAGGGPAILDRSETPEIRKVAFTAPFHWLGAGWKDLWAAPLLSLAYGAVFAAFAYVAAIQLTRFDALPLLLPLAFGFLLMGPVLAAGLYEISRRKERGEPVTIGGILHAMWAKRDQLASMGVLLFVLYFFWMDVALLLFMLFFGPANFPTPPGEFISNLVSTGHGRGLLAAGTVAGAIFAAIAYVISVIAVPMMFERKVDTITAMLTSMRAVRMNLPAMTFWAVLIAVLSLSGLAAVFAGLSITFPLVGHATWHAYRELAA